MTKVFANVQSAFPFLKMAAGGKCRREFAVQSSPRSRARSPLSQGTKGAGNSALQKFPSADGETPLSASLLGKFCKADLRRSNAKPFLLSLRLLLAEKKWLWHLYTFYFCCLLSTTRRGCRKYIKKSVSGSSLIPVCTGSGIQNKKASVGGKY